MKHLFTRAPAVFTGAAALLAGGLMAAPASAQLETETMMVLGGYTNYTVSFTKFPGGDGDGDTAGIQEQEGDISIFNNTEIFFNGSAETDGGLQVSARVELEGHNTNVGDDADGQGQLDERYITVSGGFGSIEVGANDSADERTAVGILGNSTAVGYWYWNDVTVPTGAGYRGIGQGDGMGVVYTTPSLGGASFSIGYKPSAEGVGATQSGDDNLLSFGVKYDGDMDGITLAASFGYHSHEVAAVEAKDAVYAQGFTTTTATPPETMASTSLDDRVEISKAVTGAAEKDVAVWGIGVDLGFGDTTLYARHQDEETEPEGGKATERTISSLAVSHVIGPVKLGLGWVQATKTDPNNGRRMVNGDGFALPADTLTTGTVTAGTERASDGELENEDTMLIGSVDYSLGSGVTLSGYVAWGETKQTGALHDTDVTGTTENEGASEAMDDGSTGDTGPTKDAAGTESGTAFGIALNLAF